MRNSVVNLGCLILSTLTFVSAQADTSFAIERVKKNNEAECLQYYKGEAQGDLNQLENLYKLVKDKISEQSFLARDAAKKGASSDFRPVNFAATLGIDNCTNSAERYMDHLFKHCGKFAPKSQSQTSSYQKAINRAEEVRARCHQASGQSTGTIASQGSINRYTDATDGSKNSGEKEGFLKKHGSTLAIGAVAGLGAMALMGDDKSSYVPPKKKPVEEKAPEAPVDVILDKPTDNLTQTEQTSKVPTEQTSPLVVIGNASEFDPAYTGVGSNHGDSGGQRDESAGDFVVGFACREGETDAACRVRYGCTADEALTACQARWNSGLVSVQ